jgi:hypothetical protein
MDAAKVVMSGVARLLVLQDGKEMVRLGVDEFDLQQPRERLAAKSSFFAVLGFRRAALGVTTDDIGPRPFHQLRWLGREVSLGHRTVEHRLLNRLVFGGQQAVSDDLVLGAGTSLFAGDLILKIKNSVFARKNPVTIEHACPFGKHAIPFSPQPVSELTSS